MFRLTLPLLLVALHASRIAAEVPTSCQMNRNGFFVTEDTYANKIVAFQVASCVTLSSITIMHSTAYNYTLSAPLSFNITDLYLTPDGPTPYQEILNLTIGPSLDSAVRFTPIYQRAFQSPKSGIWGCAWHRFIALDTVYNYTVPGTNGDVVLGKLDWDPSPLLMTSYNALKRDFKEKWSLISHGWIVTSNGEGDTRVMGSMARGTFLTYIGDDGRVLVGHADMARVDSERAQPIELRMVVIGDTIAG
ncbi:hypothetical protein DE146DRAFT_736047 [Phaeosphaeria sp. MPI-PUGE-AT-0046c]|nr:hypothetical protein DE146DRAFT_736047 [Phaeosphaeria sp. MPI-PUGE-AT-0046c]